METIATRLQTLRKEMIQHDIDMYLVPSIDAHNSEYLPNCWQHRSWISGFDGSAGEVMVTNDHAYLWTDGRYFLQAEYQLDSNHYSLIKQAGFISEAEQWLINNGQGKRLGIDPRLVSIDRANKLNKIMQSVDGELVVLDDNLINNSKIKLGETLNLPSGDVFYLDDNYTGRSIVSKLSWLREELNILSADYIAINVLDEIAWLFNIRGNDIDFNPLVISYAIIGKQKAILFVEPEKINNQLKETLLKNGVTIVNYNEFSDYLSSLTGYIALDEKTATYWMLSLANKQAKIKLIRSPIVLAKSIKNNTEINGAKSAHIHDAIAVVKFLSWLNNNSINTVDELSAADKLSEFRKNSPSLHGDSFATISGFASNGAVIHYRANAQTNKKIDKSSLYLIDSGGQYLEGTTDITRTIHLGVPTSQQIHHYTLVLKGHLALGRAIFPHGTCGEHLDILARLPLWSEYLNYRHGTGHGVGSFLCVHEGPQRISTGASGVPLVPGMIVSNEPGFYLDGEYGIRIENLCLVTDIAQSHTSDYGKFYTFEDLTLVPYCKKLIDVSLLSNEDKQQINRYYAKIQRLVLPLLDKSAQEWLLDELKLF